MKNTVASSKGPRMVICDPILGGFDCADHKGKHFFVGPNETKDYILILTEDFKTYINYCTLKRSR